MFNGGAFEIIIYVSTCVIDLSEKLAFVIGCTILVPVTIIYANTLLTLTMFAISRSDLN